MLSIVPDDVGVLQKLGDIYENINDKQQAYHYYYEVPNILFIYSFILLINYDFSHIATILRT